MFFRRATVPVLQVPFDAFVLTNTGEIASDQITMLRERIRTIGISLLGGNSGVEGPYELGIDEIRAVNEEDVTVPPSTWFDPPRSRSALIWPAEVEPSTEGEGERGPL